MIREPLDLKRALRLLARRKIVLALAAVLGVVAGAALGLLRPPMLSSEAWVVLPPSVRGGMPTQVVIASSDPVLTGALGDLRPRPSLNALRARVHVANRTSTILVVTAEGRTAAFAERSANAVAQSYVDYVRRAGNLPDGTVQARILQPATDATGSNSYARLVTFGLLGGSVATAVAAFAVLALGRRDRRLWERDAIADSIGVPVLASVEVDQPSDAAGWRRLLESYRPGAVDAWRLRKALQYLGVVDVSATGHSPSQLSLTVLSFAADRRALALGPQLAVFAASRGIPTALVVGPQQNVGATATLRAACTAPPDAEGRLQVVVTERADALRDVDAALIVVVTVLDLDTAQGPRLIRTTAGLLGVSAGAVTAEELARAAALAGADGQDVIGIFVADPDPADSTTGRLPQLERPSHPYRPTRITGTSWETGR